MNTSDEFFITGQFNKIDKVEQITDGSHTFEELYYHRMILFLVICEHHKDLAWKTRKYNDGKPVENNYFLVGIHTPEGDYSYHYKFRYWNLFKNIKTLNKAPFYDGYTKDDIKRLLSLVAEDKGGNLNEI